MLLLTTIQDRFCFDYYHDHLLELEQYEDNTIEDTNPLLALVNNLEVEEYFISMDANKSSGSDAFGPFFYQ